MTDVYWFTSQCLDSPRLVELVKILQHYAIQPQRTCSCIIGTTSFAENDKTFCHILSVITQIPSHFRMSVNKFSHGRNYALFCIFFSTFIGFLLAVVDESKITVFAGSCIQSTSGHLRTGK